MSFSRQPFGVDPFSGASSAIDSIGCCCVSGPTCCGCSSNPNTWQVIVSGVTNGTCSICNNYNKAWSIPLQVSTDPCIWQDDNGGGCDPESFTKLTCDPTDFVLSFDTDTAIYKRSRATWSCLGSNVMTLFSNNGSCATWPATVTVTPV